VITSAAREVGRGVPFSVEVGLGEKVRGIASCALFVLFYRQLAGYGGAKH